MKTLRRPMTPDETLAIQAMRGQVGYPPASFDKRFMGRIYDATEISAAESAQLWRIFKRYRRQVDHPDKARLLKAAEQLAAPDLRKLEAARREQAEIDALKQKYAEAMKQ